MNTPTTERNLWLAAFKHCEDKTPQQMWLPWDRFAAMFREHEERETKDGPLFSPTLYKPKAKRSKAGVQSVSCLVLDFDNGADHEQFHGDWAGFAGIIYSTYSHTAGKPKWRAVFPLSEDVPAADWTRVYRNILAGFANGLADKSVCDSSRIFYMPSCPRGAERFSFTSEGAWLDPYSFPDVEAPTPERTTHATGTTGARDSITDELLERALARAADDGRNNAGLWLACQARDNEFNSSESRALLELYQSQVPQDGDPYTLEEALHSLEQAYATAPREPWEKPGREIVLGDPTITPDLLAIARDAVARCKADNGAIFEEPAASALAHIRRWDPAEWARLLATIKKAGVSKKELDRAFEVLAPTATEPEETDQDVALAGTMLDSCPMPKLRIPYPYRLSEDRLAVVVETDGGDGKKGARLRTIVNAPILIAGRSKNNTTGEESCLLTWRHSVKEHWESRLVGREQMTNSRLLASLSGVGFPWVERCGKEIAHYLTLLEAANRKGLPLAQVSSHLGWQGKPDDDAPFLLGGSLVLPTGELEAAATLDSDHPEQWQPDRVMFSGGDGEQQIVSAFRTAGTYPQWAAAVARVLPFPRIAAVFYASLCAPLLKVFGVPNFVVDLSHATTTGKTTSLRAAASVWGNPNDTSPDTLVHTWDLTRVFLERVSHICSGVPVILDDTKRARNPQIVADVIYEVVSGRGRGRGTIKGLAHTASWQTVLLSTGEQPATSFTQDGGARTRVLSIRGLPFGDKSATVGTLAKSTNRALCANYGHAAPRFLSWLMKERENWPKWQAVYEQWVEFYSQEPATPEAGRLASYAALVTVAGAMAHQAMPELGEFANPMKDIWAEVSAEASDAAGGLRALQDVISWAHANAHRFLGRNADVFGSERPIPVETAGRWDAGPHWEFIAFHRSVLNSILSNFGFHPEGVLTEWREAGWLSHVPGKFTKRVRTSGETVTPMVVILRKAVDQVDGDADGVNEL